MSAVTTDNKAGFQKFSCIGGPLGFCGGRADEVLKNGGVSAKADGTEVCLHKFGGGSSFNEGNLVVLADIVIMPSSLLRTVTGYRSKMDNGCSNGVRSPYWLLLLQVRRDRTAAVCWYHCCSVQSYSHNTPSESLHHCHG
jgi:hypothetical protein